MFFTLPWLRRAITCAFAGLASLALLSCNNYSNNPYNVTVTTGSSFPITAYVSNPVYPTGAGGGLPALDILDATTDSLSVNSISLASLSVNVTSAGMMALSPQRDRTLVLSPTDNKIAIVDNLHASLSSALSLSGSTESFLVWTDNVTAFAAEPDAPVPGQSPGAVERFSLSTPALTATIPIPGAHYIVQSPDGSEILVFSDNSDAVTLIAPNLIGANGQSNTITPCTTTQVAVCTLTGPFDRPVGAVFSGNGASAYVLNCGTQCGGTGVGACLATFAHCTTVAALDMTQSPPAVTTSVQVPAATIGIMQGNSLLVVGTPASATDNSCAGISTAASSCGRLTQINVGSMTAATPVVITDGYHNKIQVTPNGQLFIGSRGCTNLNIAGGEQRGCLTIVNSTAGTIAQANVLAPPDNGDVTGIAPVPNRIVVYVCEGSNLRIYDTTTDQLEVFTQPQTAPSIPGEAIDVEILTF